MKQLIKCTLGIDLQEDFKIHLIQMRSLAVSRCFDIKNGFFLQWTFHKKFLKMHWCLLSAKLNKMECMHQNINVEITLTHKVKTICNTKAQVITIKTSPVYYQSIHWAALESITL